MIGHNTILPLARVAIERPQGPSVVQCGRCHADIAAPARPIKLSTAGRALSLPVFLCDPCATAIGVELVLLAGGRVNRGDAVDRWYERLRRALRCLERRPW